MADSGPSSSSADQNAAVEATDTPTVAASNSEDSGPPSPDTTETTTSTSISAIAVVGNQPSELVSVMISLFRMLRNSQIDARGNFLCGSLRLLTLRSLPPPVMRHLQSLRRLQPLHDPAPQAHLPRPRRLRQPCRLLIQQRCVNDELVGQVQRAACLEMFFLQFLSR